MAEKLLTRPKPDAYSPKWRKENRELLLLFLPAAFMIILFHYIPMWGVVIAFQDYLAGNPMFALDGSVKWVGLKHFTRFVNSLFFKRIVN